MSETMETAAPESPVADVVVDTAPAATEAAAPVVETETAEPEAEPEAKPDPVKRDWRETRIDQLTREKHEARREAERYRALVEAASKPTEGGKPAAGFVPETEVERRAAQLAEQREYQARLQSWGERGSKEFKDFNERCATVAGLGLAPSEKPEFMATIADMDDGHKVVAYLADHPDTAMDLAKMPAHRMALKLASLSASLNKPAPISRAPAPVSPVVGAVTPTLDIYDPNLPADKYYEMRKAQRAARKR